MKVTPRLPTHGLYASSPLYVEMRYVRFQAFSSSVSILFSLLELATLPYFSSLRTLILQEAAFAGPFNKRVISFCVDSKISPEDLLLAWNSDVLDIGKEAKICFAKFWDEQRGQFKSNFEEYFGIQVDRYGQERRLKEGKLQIIVDHHPTESRILYKSYSVQSFTEIPVCHHIHLKHILYQRARKAMGKPMTREDMERKVRLPCLVQGCEIDIGLKIFEIGQKSGKGNANEKQIIRLMSENGSFAEIYTGNRAKPSDMCQNCLSNIGLHYCLGGCSLCLSCAVISSYSNIHLRCPICSFRLKSDRLQDIFQVRSLQNTLQNQVIVIYCGRCRQEKGISSFSKIQQLMHRCWICDICLVSMSEMQKSQQCESCNERFSQGDIDDLVVWRAAKAAEMRMEVRNVALIWQFCSICQINKGMQGFKCYLSGVHHCFICDNCLFQGFSSDQHTLQCQICSISLSAVNFIQAMEECNPLIRCLACTNSFPIDNFSINTRLSHWWRCKICDFCWLQEMQQPNKNSEYCRVCQLNWKETDREVFARLGY